jgi:hypothetical protein
MSNRVHVVCTDLTVDSGGAINVDGKGYAAGYGPGAGPAAGFGGGYGGQGQNPGMKPGGAPYGSAQAPLAPGSGGFSTGGTAGGGAVRIEAQGAVTVNGEITADTSGNVAAPGSGGGIYITCETFAGSGGTVSAEGGYPFYSSGNGGGGGGRIAVDYDTVAQAGEPVPDVTFSVAPGKRLNDSQYKFRGDLGTLYLPDMQWLTETIPHSGRLVTPGFTSWSASSLIVQGWVRFPAEDFDLTVSGDVVVDGLHARLDMGEEQWANRAAFNNWCNPTNGPTLTVGGDLTLVNSGTLSIHSGATNGVPEDYGALVDVAGTLSVGANSWVKPFSHPIDGGSALFRLDSLTIASASGFDAGGRGWAGGYFGLGYGPGAGLNTKDGAGYGGLGHRPGGVLSGSTYGSADKPLLPGSGGSCTTAKAGNGGGVVWIEAGAVTLDGTIRVDGMADGSIEHRVGGGTAGGSGGSIYLLCDTISGSGSLTARGGYSTASTSGVGGGGRIAVWFGEDLTGGAVTTDVTGGVCPYGTADSGTVVWSAAPPRGTVLRVR